MILVTGATGLVGSHLVKALSAQGKSVRALYRSAPPFEAQGVSWVQADILDIHALETALQGISQVYHCAAVVSFNPRNRRQLHAINIEGTANVVNGALDAGIDKMVYVSSVAALGRIREKETVNETMHWSPETSNSEYGKSKYLAEMEVWRAVGEGLNAVIVNPSIILGAGDWIKGSSEIFQSVYNEFPWYTEGVSGFTYIDDLVNAMIQLMESDITAERFIINNDNLTYKDLFTQIAQAFHKKPPHKKVTPFIAALVWRLEAIKAMFTGKSPLLTKETAATAQAKVYFDNSKLLQYLPGFTYTPISLAIKNICTALKEKYNLR